jgi:hypothetical protein
MSAFSGANTGGGVKLLWEPVKTPGSELGRLSRVGILKPGAKMDIRHFTRLPGGFHKYK